MTLSLTSLLNHNLINKKEQLLYIGCILKSDESKINILYPNIKFENKKILKKEEISERYDICEKIFFRILIDIRKKLNDLHKINYSVRSWELILGKWLREFIYISYRDYHKIENIFENVKIEKFISLNPEKYNLATNNTQDLFYTKLDNNWIALLHSKIVKFLKPSLTQIFLERNDQYKSNYKVADHKINVGKKIIKSFFEIFNFFKLKNEGVLYKTHLPFLFEKILEIKLNQFPKFWKLPSHKFKSPNINKRQEITIKSHNENNLNFENFLREIIHESLPTYVVEDFSELNKIVIKSNFPKNPKFIFTSVGFAYDELFKIYLANCIEKKIPFYVMAHGNNYFTDIHTKYLSEINTSDVFISWGENLNSKTLPAFNLNTVGRKTLWSESGKLSIYCNPILRPNAPYDREHVDRKNLNNTLNMIKLLKSEIKKQTYIKFHPSFTINKDGDYYKNLFEQSNFKNYSYNEKNSTVLKQSRLILFNYESSGLMENLALKIPSICLMNKEFDHIKEEKKECYNLLLEAGVIFEDSNALILHINRYWENINDWWLNSTTQKKIDAFNELLNIPYNQKKNTLEKILS
jgi:putative transferase (TIGR04331 family)